jgi:hypothetical protein
MLSGHLGKEYLVMWSLNTHSNKYVKRGGMVLEDQRRLVFGTL